MDVLQAEEPHSTEVSLELKPVSSTYTYAEQQEYNQMCSTSYENKLVLFCQINIIIVFMYHSWFAQILHFCLRKFCTVVIRVENFFSY